MLLDELNLATQAVLEGLNACLDHRGTVYVPELDRYFHRPASFRVFAAQNPVNQGGGRRGLPKSFLNRFTRVYVDPLTPDDMLFIARTMYPALGAAPAVSTADPVNGDSAEGVEAATSSPSDSEHLLQQIIEFTRHVHEDTMGAAPLYGRAGKPWEFNLRDVFRWCDLLLRSGSAGGGWDVRHAAWILFGCRLRTADDRGAVAKRFQAVFGGVPLCRPPVPALKFTPEHVVLDSIRLPRHTATTPAEARLVQSSAIPPLPTALLRPLAAVAQAVAAAWPCLLVGGAATGKTQVVRRLAAMTGWPLREVALSPSTDSTELIGCFEQADVGRAGEQLLAEVRDVVWAASHAALAAPDSSEDGTAMPPAVAALAGAVHTEWMALCDRVEGDKAAATECGDSLDDATGWALASGHAPLFASLHRLAKALPPAAAPGLAARVAELKARVRASKREFVAVKVATANQQTGEAQQRVCHRRKRQRGAFTWVDGPLVEAMEAGHWLLLDNANFCDATVLDRLNPVMEPGGSLLVNECGLVDGSSRLVHAAPGFRVFLTVDPAYGELSRAMRNRCLEVSFLAPETAGPMPLRAPVGGEQAEDEAAAVVERLGVAALTHTYAQVAPIATPVAATATSTATATGTATSTTGDASSAGTPAALSVRDLAVVANAAGVLGQGVPLLMGLLHCACWRACQRRGYGPAATPGAPPVARTAHAMHWQPPTPRQLEQWAGLAVHQVNRGVDAATALATSFTAVYEHCGAASIACVAWRRSATFVSALQALAAPSALVPLMDPSTLPAVAWFVADAVAKGAAAAVAPGGSLESGAGGVPLGEHHPLSPAVRQGALCQYLVLLACRLGSADVASNTAASVPAPLLAMADDNDAGAVRALLADASRTASGDASSTSSSVLAELLANAARDTHTVVQHPGGDNQLPAWLLYALDVALRAYFARATAADFAFRQAWLSALLHSADRGADAAGSKPGRLVPAVAAAIHRHATAARSVMEGTPGALRATIVTAHARDLASTHSLGEWSGATLLPLQQSCDPALFAHVRHTMHRVAEAGLAGSNATPQASWAALQQALRLQHLHAALVERRTVQQQWYDAADAALAAGRTAVFPVEGVTTCMQLAHAIHGVGRAQHRRRLERSAPHAVVPPLYLMCDAIASTLQAWIDAVARNASTGSGSGSSSGAGGSGDVTAMGVEVSLRVLQACSQLWDSVNSVVAVPAAAASSATRSPFPLQEVLVLWQGLVAAVQAAWPAWDGVLGAPGVGHGAGAGAGAASELQHLLYAMSRVHTQLLASEGAADAATAIVTNGDGLRSFVLHDRSALWHAGGHPVVAVNLDAGGAAAMLRRLGVSLAVSVGDAGADEAAWPALLLAQASPDGSGDGGDAVTLKSITGAELGAGLSLSPLQPLSLERLLHNAHPVLFVPLAARRELVQAVCTANWAASGAAAAAAAGAGGSDSRGVTIVVQLPKAQATKLTALREAVLADTLSQLRADMATKAELAAMGADSDDDGDGDGMGGRTAQDPPRVDVPVSMRQRWAAVSLWPLFEVHALRMLGVTMARIRALLALTVSLDTDAVVAGGADDGGVHPDAGDADSASRCAAVLHHARLLVASLPAMLDHLLTATPWSVDAVAPYQQLLWACQDLVAGNAGSAEAVRAFRTAALGVLHSALAAWQERVWAGSFNSASLIPALPPPPSVTATGAAGGASTADLAQAALQSILGASGDDATARGPSRLMLPAATAAAVRVLLCGTSGDGPSKKKRAMVEEAAAGGTLRDQGTRRLQLTMLAAHMAGTAAATPMDGLAADRCALWWALDTTLAVFEPTLAKGDASTTVQAWVLHHRAAHMASCTVCSGMDPGSARAPAQAPTCAEVSTAASTSSDAVLADLAASGRLDMCLQAVRDAIGASSSSSSSSSFNDNAASDASRVASVAFAWVLVGLARFELVAPRSPLDPSTRPTVQLAVLRRQRNTCTAEAAVRRWGSVLGQAHDAAIGQLVARTADIDDQCAPLAEQEVQRASGPECFAEVYHDIRRGAADFMRASRVVPVAQVLAQTCGVPAGGAGAAATRDGVQDTAVHRSLAQVLTWQRSVEEFTKQLGRRHAAFEDVTKPVLTALGEVRQGLQHLAHAATDAQRQAQDADAATAPGSNPNAGGEPSRAVWVQTLYAVYAAGACLPVGDSASANGDGSTMEELLGGVLEVMPLRTWPWEDQARFVHVKVSLLRAVLHRLVARTEAGWTARDGTCPPASARLVRRVLAAAYGAWAAARAAAAEAAAAEAAAFVLKGKATVHEIETEEAKVEKEFQELFPSYHDEYADLLPDDPTKPIDPEAEDAALAAAQEKERELAASGGEATAAEIALGSALKPADVKLLCQVHRAFFGGSGGRDGDDAAAELDMGRRVAAQRVAVHCLEPYLRNIEHACLDVGAHTPQDARSRCVTLPVCPCVCGLCVSPTMCMPACAGVAYARLDDRVEPLLVASVDALLQCAEDLPQPSHALRIVHTKPEDDMRAELSAPDMDAAATLAQRKPGKRGAAMSASAAANGVEQGWASFHDRSPSAEIKLALPHIRAVRSRTLELLREFPNNAVLSLVFRVVERVLELPLASSLLKVCGANAGAGVLRSWLR